MTAKNNLINRLNKRIEIQTKSTTNDESGGFKNTWATSKKVWAEIKPTDLYENFEGEKISEKISHIITTRYISDLRINNRIKYNDRMFNIKGIINNLEENKIMEIKVEEIFEN